MGNRLIGAALISAALACSGCANTDWIDGGPLIRPGEPTGFIDVVNATPRTVNAVLISNCNASTYGLNRISPSNPIYSGQTRRFTVSAGCWDVDAGSIGYGEAKQRMTVAPGRLTRYTVH